MGKKKKDKKGKGKEKTEFKTEKNQSRKLKKLLSEKGEDDIEEILANLRKKDSERVDISENVSLQGPSPRANATLVAHPFKNELILFGGEFYNGETCSVYNDLYFFNLKTREWKQVFLPSGPAPRCAHQCVIVEKGGGEMWIFGGEFTSPSESQFYHYKDLWVLHLNNLRWEEVICKESPRGRSGHRMVLSGHNLVVFGGYVDNGRDIKYNNELSTFDLETRTWKIYPTTPNGPRPRSGFQLGAFKDTVFVHGGYSVEKKGRQEFGIVHTDLWSFSFKSGKWTKIKPAGGFQPPPLSGCGATTFKDRLYFFGGVFDEDLEEDLQSIFSNELFVLEFGSHRWSVVELRGKAPEKKRRRRKPKASNNDNSKNDNKEGEEDDDDEGEEEEGSDEEGPEEEEKDEKEEKEEKKEEEKEEENKEELVVPIARRNGMVTIKAGKLYLYGGIKEDADNERDLTLNDLHCLDLTKLQQWETLCPLDLSSQTWISLSDDDEEGEGEDDDEDDDDDDDEDSDDEDEKDKKPKKKKEKPIKENEEEREKAEKKAKSEIVEEEEEAEEKVEVKTKKKAKKKVPQENEDTDDVIDLKPKKKTKKKDIQEEEEEAEEETEVKPKKKTKKKVSPQEEEEAEEEPEVKPKKKTKKKVSEAEEDLLPEEKPKKTKKKVTETEDIPAEKEDPKLKKKTKKKKAPEIVEEEEQEEEERPKAKTKKKDTKTEEPKKKTKKKKSDQQPDDE